MAQISPGPERRRATGELAHGSLRLSDAIAISVSVLAPGMAMLLNVSGVAAISGGSTPLAFLLGGIACLALAFVVIGFTRRMASAGYAYTYASRSLGKGAGFMAGWLYFFGMICFVPMTMSGVGYLAADLLGLNPKLWILFFFIGMALFLLLSIIRIKVTTRVQLVVGIVTVVDHPDRRPGDHGQGRQPRAGAVGVHLRAHRLRGGFNGVFYGIILGVTSYIGFETAADFGEETSNPRRYIPIAVIAATAVRRGLLPVDHVLDHDRLRRQQRGEDRRRPGRPEDHGHHVRRLLARHAGRDRRHAVARSSCAWPARPPPSRTLFAMGREGVLPKALRPDLAPVQDAGERDDRAWP